MSDFREYRAAFMDHQNDLMHYGVKNMKWGHHKRKPITMESMAGRNFDWAKFYLNLDTTKDNIQIAKHVTDGRHFVPGTNGTQFLSDKEEEKLDKKDYKDRMDRLIAVDRRLGEERRKKKQMYERYKSQYGKKKG